MEDIKEYSKFIEKIRLSAVSVDNISWNLERRETLRRESHKKKELLKEFEEGGENCVLSLLDKKYFEEGTKRLLGKTELTDLFSTDVNVIEESTERAAKYQKIKKIVESFLYFITEENMSLISKSLNS